MTDTLEATLNPPLEALDHSEHEEHFDYQATKMGMWLFLFTELLLFGGLFIAYAFYRYLQPADFHAAAKELNPVLGLVNTLVLLTSSMTVAMSLSAMQKGNRRLSLLLIWFTVVCAGVFLVIKYIEWTTKFHHGIYPGGPTLLERPAQQVFFGLYFVMTGLHGLHVIFGAVFLITVAMLLKNRPTLVRRFSPNSALYNSSRIIIKGADGEDLWASESLGNDVEDAQISVRYEPSAARIAPVDYVILENAALYWHLVDIIWIFLFPLFYLIT